MSAAEVARVLEAAGSGDLIDVQSGIAKQGESFADLASVDGLGERVPTCMVVDAAEVVRVEAEGLGDITGSDMAMEVFRNIVIGAS